MSELGPDARRLVEAAKGALDPSAADQARVLAAIQKHLAHGSVGQEVATTPPLARPAWPIATVGALGTGLVVLALGWGLASLPSSPRAAPAPSATPVPAPQLSVVPPTPQPKAPPAQPAPHDASAVPAPASTLTPAPPRTNEPSTKARSTRLAEEVAILSRATSALHAGRADEALAAAAEHQRKFPAGMLAEERIAVRAQALCLLGRTGEAERALARLSPSSPHGARARQRCGLEQ